MHKWLNILHALEILAVCPRDFCITCNWHICSSRGLSMRTSKLAGCKVGTRFDSPANLTEVLNVVNLHRRGIKRYLGHD